MREFWDAVFQGNGQASQTAVDFVAQNAAWMVSGPTQQVPEIDPLELQRAFRRNAPTAGGLDGWTPEELRHVPVAVCASLAKMLMA
eukprot:14476227-Alexandrium_andersonii.AAC.1